MTFLNKGILLRYYKRREIQEALVEHAKNKEIGMRYDQHFGKRPDILMYPRDVLELALKNLTSLHASEEIWSNPLSLSSELSRAELDELRIGWDLVLDIDCKVLDYSKICADLIVKFLLYCGVLDLSVKFSGNKGFHIAVPFEAFPKTIRDVETKKLFPEAPKKIAFYIKENIKEELAKRILAFENNDLGQIKKKVDLEQKNIVYQEKNQFGDNITVLNVEEFLEIDTVLISSRHLYRMPYSLHEKSGLVSLPINPEEVLLFRKEQAKPNLVNPTLQFINRDVKEESARRLLQQSLDFEVKNIQQNESKSQEYEETVIENPIKEEFFPPCIKKILEGLEDGKKRSIFCLINFLGKLGWSKKEIETFLINWNKRNPKPLRNNYIQGQLKNFQPGKILPPNCNNESYYKGINVCKPDNFCSRIKNPVNYTLLKWKNHLQENKKDKD